MSEREIDQLLVERAQAGDKHAFEMLVAKYQRKLARLLSRFVRDQAEVEDVAQEAFIKAYRALPSFRGDSAFYTWLYRIGINTAKNYLVAQGRRAPTSTEFDAQDAESFEDAGQLRDINTPESLLQSKQIGETINAAMDGLPEELRSAIVLREIEGLSYEEIAVAMSCPIGTVRSRIFRAREAVAEKLRPLLVLPTAGGSHAPDILRGFRGCLDGSCVHCVLPDARRQRGRVPGIIVSGR
jgi:RNA polymerase sigma-70 factor (ECF subfamily)